MTGTGLGDTIAAIATAPGRGAVALVRVSGPDAIPSLLSLCPELRGEAPPARSQRLLRVCDPETGQLVDRSLVSCFPAPGSYTGEDCVEISTHGGFLTPGLVLELLEARGVRSALAGEFTRRALLNGKLDLPQAEAVLDLIDARSPAFHRAAVDQLERGLSDRVVALRSRILAVEAMVAYGIDFPDEDEPPVPPERVRAAAIDAIDAIHAILDTAPQGNLLRRGAMVVLAGVPNSGKSSLFNALLGLDRAIVTDMPGTTRDAVEAEITLDGFPFRLVDTAGLRDTSDTVEALGVEVARRYLASADLVLFCRDISRGISPAERAFIDSLAAERRLVVLTKADLIEATGANGARDVGVDGLPVSVRTGAGLLDLRRALVDFMFAGVSSTTPDHPLVTTARHANALRRATVELRHFLNAFEGGVPPELAATHLRDAAEALQDLIGVVASDDVLGAVFEGFCVGK